LVGVHAGGVGFGMRHVLTWASDDDWIVLLDDDDPPRSEDALAVLEEFAQERLRADERTAAVLVVDAGRLVGRSLN